MKKLVQFTTGKIVWHRASPKRFYAKIDALFIEIKMSKFDRKWRVGNVFGASWLDGDNSYDRPEDAAKLAIKVARKALTGAAKALKEK